MSRSAEAAQSSTLPNMHRSFQVFQLNIRKQRMVQHSMMNNPQLKDFEILAISEPYSWIIDNAVVTVPMGHQN
jgi:hypothetical protein